jgi:DNA-binding protein WhiA
MSFTQDVKRELAAIVPSEAHCGRAQLAGLLFAAGTFEIASGGQYTVRVSSRLPAVARSVLSLLRPMGAHAELRTTDTPPTGLRYEVVLGDDPRHLQVLNEAGVLSDSFRVQIGVPGRIVAQRCCRVAFARGAFLGCGSISPPGSAVHAEFTFESEELAEDCRLLLGRLGLDFRVAVRERNAACYTKRGETAADLLAVLGAHGARLSWEEHLVFGEVRGRANRLANCDQANAGRAARAALRQAETVRALMATEAWAALPAALRSVAALRLKYPYLSLPDLAAKARPQLTKSALNHRLRRLEALAAERGVQPRPADRISRARRHDPGRLAT